VATQTGVPDSLLALYRRLLALRRTHPALSAGSAYEDLPSSPDVYAYRRGRGDDGLAVVLNFADEPRTAAVRHGGLPSSGRVVLDSRTAAPGAIVDLDAVHLLPDQGLLIEPA
jgi:glycosidase